MISKYEIPDDSTGTSKDERLKSFFTPKLSILLSKFCFYIFLRRIDSDPNLPVFKLNFTVLFDSINPKGNSVLPS